MTLEVSETGTSYIRMILLNSMYLSEYEGDAYTGHSTELVAEKTSDSSAATAGPYVASVGEVDVAVGGS